MTAQSDQHASPPPPVIGLNLDVYSDAGGDLFGLRPKYVRAIRNAGGIPFLLPPLPDRATMETALARCSGFLLTGGDDIPGETFGCRSLPTVLPADESRRHSDFVLVELLLELRMPTLAVCLGCQQLNIHKGGTLLQDILFDGPPSEIRHYATVGDPPLHEVRIAPGTLLARIVGDGEPLTVRSTHHQAVGRLAPGLRVNSTAPDGIIEGIEFEVTEHPFFLGVQWHPEESPDCPRNRRLFETLISHASQRDRAGEADHASS